MDEANIRARMVGHKEFRPDRSVVLHHQRLRGEDFTARKLDSFSAEACRFDECRFDRMRINSTSFGAGREQSEYVECSFDKARMRFFSGGNARFVRCSFRDVDLRDWYCFRVELIDCVFSGRLRGAIFNGTVPEEDRAAAAGRRRNEFRGNDFSGMELIDVAFRTGIDLTQQRLPTSPEYLYLPDARLAVEHARSAVVGWENLDLRQRCLTFIGSLQSELEGGQRQLLLRPGDYYGYSGLREHMLDAVFGILRQFAVSPP